MSSHPGCPSCHCASTSGHGLMLLALRYLRQNGRSTRRELERALLIGGDKLDQILDEDDGTYFENLSLGHSYVGWDLTPAGRNLADSQIRADILEVIGERQAKRSSIRASRVAHLVPWDRRLVSEQVQLLIADGILSKDSDNRVRIVNGE